MLCLPPSRRGRCRKWSSGLPREDRPARRHAMGADRIRRENTIRSAQHHRNFAIKADAPDATTPTCPSESPRPRGTWEWLHRLLFKDHPHVRRKTAKGRCCKCTKEPPCRAIEKYRLLDEGWGNYSLTSSGIICFSMLESRGGLTAQHGK